MSAQDTIPKKEVARPKIGLVLSGGGAKGFAHIGVLKEIEKAGIQIDYIGGTSMGAIIGGLYASGYNAQQLDSIFKNTNFDELVKDYVPRSNKSFYEKRNDEIYVLTLPFQNFKISIPKALSKGMYTYNLISKLTYKSSATEDFNQLKIPFVCITTNLETGKEKVLRNGSLPLALTASSSFPSLFAPVIIKDSIYIDGGVSNNYPIEEVKKMGADIIIGVDVQDGLKNRHEINGAIGILTQISNFQMIDNMNGKRKETSIYINPDTEGYSVVSFDDGAQIIQKGEEAAQKVKEELQKLGTNYVKPFQKIEKNDSIYINNINVIGNENYTQSYVIGKVRIKPKHKIRYSDLQIGINNLDATQNFNVINYNLVTTDQGNDLIVNVRENKIKTYFKAGIHYDDLFKTSVLVNLTQKKFLFNNDAFSFDFIVGDNLRYNLDYYIDNGFHWSFGLKSTLNQFKKTIQPNFDNQQIINPLGLNRINIDYLDVTNQIYIQTFFAQKFLAGTGIEHKYIDVFSNSIQTNAMHFDKSNYLSVIGFLKYDSFNNKYFPKRGWYFFGEAQTYLSSSNYNQNFIPFTTFKADAAIVKTIFKKIAIKMQTEGGFLVGTESNSVFDFFLGGYGFTKINNIKPFYGYDYFDLAGNSYVKASVSLDYEILKKNHLNITANYTNIGNNIFNSKEWISSPKYSGYALGYGIETLLGPVEIKQSWSPETGKSYTWFSVGFWF